LRSAGPVHTVLDGFFDREWPGFSNDERQVVVEVVQRAAWAKAEAIAVILDRDDHSLNERAAYLAISEAYRAVHDDIGVHLHGDFHDPRLMTIVRQLRTGPDLIPG